MANQPDVLPADLYHYTNVGGLHGILEKQQLWATHVTYLNDSQEFLLGMGVIDAQLDKLPSSPPARLQNVTVPTPSDILAALPFGAKQGLQQNFRVLSDILRKEAGPFVACLSAAGNQLSQWRGYGAGGGYAIRFDANALQRYLLDHAPDVKLATEGVYALPIQKRELGRVIYQASEVISLIDGRITELINHFQTFMDNVFVRRQPPPEHPDRELQALLGPGMAELLGLATRLKHDGFEEEKEYRIVTFCPPEFFCPSEIGLIPRVNIRFDPSSIQGIMIGPGQHMDTRESSVRAYLDRHKDRYSHVKVCQSEIPFTGV
jgi:hypothetical protein